MATRSAPQMIALATCSAWAMPPEATSVTSSRMPCLDQRAVNVAQHVADVAAVVPSPLGEGSLGCSRLPPVPVEHQVDHLGPARANSTTRPPRPAWPATRIATIRSGLFSSATPASGQHVRAVVDHHQRRRPVASAAGATRPSSSSGTTWLVPTATLGRDRRRRERPPACPISAAAADDRPSTTGPRLPVLGHHVEDHRQRASPSAAAARPPAGRRRTPGAAACGRCRRWC